MIDPLPPPALLSLPPPHPTHLSSTQVAGANICIKSLTCSETLWLPTAWEQHSCCRQSSAPQSGCPGASLASSPISPSSLPTLSKAPQTGPRPVPHCSWCFPSPLLHLCPGSPTVLPGQHKGCLLLEAFCDHLPEGSELSAL